MKINKDYMYFKRWFKSIEVSAHQGQWSDENLAYSAFREGMKREDNKEILVPINYPTKEDIIKLLEAREKLISKKYVSDIKAKELKIDSLRDEIFSIVWNHFDLFEVDFIMEMFTRFGCAFNLIYNDNGRWAFGYSCFGPVAINKLKGDFITPIDSKKQWKKTIRKALKYWIKNEYLDGVKF